MNEISFPLLDKWRCSISLSGSGKEDFFKHTCASMLVEAQASAQGAVMKVILRRPQPSTPALSGGRGAAIALLKAGAAWSGMGLAGSARTAQTRHLSPRPGRSLAHEANDILRRELDAQRRPKRAGAECTQVLVEVAHPRRQGKRLNARCFGAFGQCRERHVTRGIGVAHDVEPAQCVREQDGSEVVEAA